MFSYSDKEAESTISSILGKCVQVTPIGNHHLKRHLVYLVRDKYEVLGVFKLYYKKDRWRREVGTLKLLGEANIKCPRIIKYGKFSDDTEWLFMSYVDEKVFEKVRDYISDENLKEIYLEIGEELSKIHRIKTFKCFGTWDENCNPTNVEDNFCSTV